MPVALDWREVGAMRRKAGKFAFLFFVFLVLTALASVSAAKTIYVPDDYAKIQWAVDNATAGDMIIVRDGTYIENVDVNVDNLTIRSENGSVNCTVQANSNNHVFEVTADCVNISGFTIKGPTGYSSGIYLGSGVDHCNISNNNIFGLYGIYLNEADYNTIANNQVGNRSFSGGYGVTLSNSHANLLKNNTIINFGGWGVAIEGSNNILFNNSICFNPEPGIILSGSNNTLVNNNISYNGMGLTLSDARDSDILNNLIFGSWWGNGIAMWNSENNTLINNTINLNWGGISLDERSNNNTISGNNISDNGFGIIAYSNNNIIYLNNFINNKDQVYSDSPTNIWNSTEQITYTYNGIQYTNYLGNYWSDYKGSDADGDGIGDTPYSIDGDKNYYPLVEPFENYFTPGEPKIIDVSWSGSTRKDVFNRSDSITFHIVVSECDPEEIDFNVSLENEKLSIRYNLSGTVEYVGNQTFKFESEIPPSAFVGIYDVYVYLYVNSELRDVYVASEKIYIIFESPTKYQGFVCDRIHPVRISDLYPSFYPSLRLLLRALDLLLANEFEIGYFNITSFNPDSIVWEDTIQDVNGMSEYLSASYIVSDVKSHIDYNYNVTGKPPNILTIIWNFFFGGKNAGVNTSPTEDCAWWDTDEQIYLSRKGVCNDYSDLYISKLRSLNIPARRVSGLFVKDFTPTFHVWVETYIDNKCYLAEPTGGVLTDDFKYYAKRGYTVILALTKEESETGKTINVADRYRFSEKVILKEDDENIEILLTNLTDTYYLILAYPTKHEFKRYIIKNKTQEMLTVPKESLTVYLFSDNGRLIDFASTNDEPKVRNLVKLNTTINIPEYLIGFLNMGLIDEEEIKNMVLREIVMMKKLPYYVKYKMDKDVNLTLIVPENDITYFATKIKTLKIGAQSLNNFDYYRFLCSLNTS